MEINKKDTNKQYETPLVYPIGWVIIFFGSIPVLIGIHDRNLTANIIGAAMLLLGGILLIIGKIISASLIKKSAKKNVGKIQ